MEKNIFTYWHQGFEQAPSGILPCIDQWKKLHPDWDIKLLDQYNIYEYAEPLPIKTSTLDKMTLPHQSDLLRTQLLIKYGGVWADPTIFPLKPLDDWLFDHMQAGYFLFYKPGRDRIIANWFIAAEPGNTMLKELYSALIDYWNKNDFKNISNPKTGKVVQINRFINRNLYLPKLWFTPVFTKILRLCTYMVYHHMFYNLLSKNNILKKQFELMPKISADLPLSFKKEILKDHLDEELKKIVDQKKSPMIKLNWRRASGKVPENSNLSYLFKSNYEQTT